MSGFTSGQSETGWHRYWAAIYCPHCATDDTQTLNTATDLAYSACAVVFEIVLCRLRYKLSLRNLAETYLLRRFEFTAEAVRDWQERFAPLLAEAHSPQTKRESGQALVRG